MDPRITIAFCKRVNLDVNKVFSKAILQKFPWALGIESDYTFVKKELSQPATSAQAGANAGALHRAGGSSAPSGGQVPGRVPGQVAPGQVPHGTTWPGGQPMSYRQALMGQPGQQQRGPPGSLGGGPPGSLPVKAPAMPPKAPAMPPKAPAPRQFPPQQTNGTKRPAVAGGPSEPPAKRNKK